MKKIIYVFAALLLMGCAEQKKVYTLQNFEVMLKEQTDTIVAECYEWTNYSSVLDFKIDDEVTTSYRAYDVKRVRRLNN